LHHPHIRLVRLIPSADSNSLTLFLHDAFHRQWFQDTWAARRLAAGDRRCGHGAFRFAFPLPGGDLPQHGETTASRRGRGINGFPSGDERAVLLGAVRHAGQQRGQGPGHAAAFGHHHGGPRRHIRPQLLPAGPLANFSRENRT
jgi:hypothetical protein